MQMAKKKKAVEEKKVEEAILVKFMANEKFVTFYYEPKPEDPKGLIGYGQIVDAEVSDEWLSYELEGKKVYSLKSHFVKL